MKKTKKFTPYIAPDHKKVNFSRKLFDRSGVYLIFGKNNKLVYVGHSKSDLYKTVLRHFQSWNDKTQFRAVYNRRTHSIRLISTTKAKAYNLESALIKKYKPKDNTQKLNLIPNPKDKRALSEMEKADTIIKK